MGIRSKNHAKTVRWQNAIQLPPPNEIEDVILDEEDSEEVQTSPPEEEPKIVILEEFSEDAKEKVDSSPNQYVGKIYTNRMNGSKELVVGWGMYEWPHEVVYVTLGDSGRLPLDIFKMYFE